MNNNPITEAIDGGIEEIDLYLSEVTSLQFQKDIQDLLIRYAEPQKIFIEQAIKNLQKLL